MILESRTGWRRLEMNVEPWIALASFPLGKAHRMLGSLTPAGAPMTVRSSGWKVSLRRATKS